MNDFKPATQADAALARARRLLHDHRTRAKKAGAVLDYTLADVRQLLANTSLCSYCRLPVSFAAQLDHRVPIARNGKHALANLAVSCQRCNSIKGALTETEFRELMALLFSWHPSAAADLQRRLIAGGAKYAAGRQRRHA